MSRVEEGMAMRDVYREAAVRLNVHSHNIPIANDQSAREIPVDVYGASSHKVESRLGEDL